ncbi:unnamed protein product, partial [Chrysoparadoxa australica]
MTGIAEVAAPKSEGDSDWDDNLSLDSSTADESETEDIEVIYRRCGSYLSQESSGDTSNFEPSR